MNKLAIFMADGCEEIEGLTVVDILRRAGITIEMFSIKDTLSVEGAHGINFMADKTISELCFDEYDGFVIPGGMPGTLNLGESETVCGTMKKAFGAGKLVAAVCAAPSVLGKLGILDGKKATCYPGFEDKLIGASCSTESAVKDGNVITSRGMGTAIDFALEIVSYFLGDEKANQLGKGIIYK